MKQDKQKIEEITKLNLVWLENSVLKPMKPVTTVEYTIENEDMKTELSKSINFESLKDYSPVVDVDEDETLNKPNDCITRFFDFYVLGVLDYFAGPDSLNHENRSRRIREQYEMVVEEMYPEIRRALEYSVLREFRHFNKQTTDDHRYDGSYDYDELKLLSDFSDKCDDWFEKKILQKHLDGKSTNIPLNGATFRILYDGYMEYPWEEAYGGKLWGIATELLFENPKTTKDRELWVDRVLDLHHNNGHLLNKTKFNYLSNSGEDGLYVWDGTFTNDKNTRRRGRLYEHCALDYRRNAVTLSDLSLYASTKVRNLSTANMNYLPEALR